MSYDTITRIMYDIVAVKGASELQSVLHNLHRGWARARAS